MAEYFIVNHPKGARWVDAEPTGFGEAYKILFERAALSGSELWLAYSAYNFNNPVQKGDEERYKQRGPWAELVHDTVRQTGKEDSTGRLPAVYTSHAGTDLQEEHTVLIPSSGWYVPTDDGLFYGGTIIPFETVDNKQEAIKRLGKAGMPAEQVSRFWRPSDYNNFIYYPNKTAFVDRISHPSSLDESGWFYVNAGVRPSVSGDDRVAVRATHIKTKLAEALEMMASGTPVRATHIKTKH